MLEARLSSILKRLEKYGNVEVKQLSMELGVTEKTIRQDLIRMEKLGYLKRVHGGAVINAKESQDALSNSLRSINLGCKEQIAQAAFDYLRNNNSSGTIIFIDAGTTNYELSKLMRNLDNLTIITNDLLIASRLSNMVGNLHLTGGTLSNNVNRYLTGSDAISMINNHFASVCFIGTSSIDPDLGLYTQTDDDAQIKRAIISRSSTTICLADHTKFAKTSFVKFAESTDFDIIITDQETPKEKIESLEQRGIKVIVAKESS